MKYLIVLFISLGQVLLAQRIPRVDLLLPERTRLLTQQQIDLVIEARNVDRQATLRVLANGKDISSSFLAHTTELDCDGTPASIYRADLYSFAEPGDVKLSAEVISGGQRLLVERTIQVKPFSLPKTPRNYILFIGDAMGNAYRDAARIVSRSTETRPGVAGMREGFLDRWLEMDQMPVTGLVMTYGFASLVPDSAETATHWSTGNKNLTGMLSTFPDGNDCRWRKPGGTDLLSAVRDNPRIESFLEFLKRRYHYRTGNLSTAFIADATPAAQGSHVALRGATFEIARQYLENPMLSGAPAFDLIFGGGKEDFDPDIRSDGRDLVAEFRSKGYRFVSTSAEMKMLGAKDTKVLGLFRRPNQVKISPNGLTVTRNGNMDVAYDKLGLLGKANARPGSEPLPDFGVWKDQPFLDEMTRKALEILSGPEGGQPFALQVEGALIDKESHPNNASGVIWDTIELDKAVGVARRWSKEHSRRPTLMLVTGDHSQTMSILGVEEISDADLTNREPVTTAQGPYYRDAAVNLRSSLPASLPPEITKNVERGGLPDYQDMDGDGYPENREVNGKGRRRLAVGFRTGDHEGSSLPITAEGPGAYLFLGYMDQTDIFFRSAQALSEDTSALDKFLDEVKKRQGR